MSAFKSPSLSFLREKKSSVKKLAKSSPHFAKEEELNLAEKCENQLTVKNKKVFHLMKSSLGTGTTYTERQPRRDFHFHSAFALLRVRALTVLDKYNITGASDFQLGENLANNSCMQQLILFLAFSSFLFIIHRALSFVTRSFTTYA